MELLASFQQAKGRASGSNSGGAPSEGGGDDDTEPQGRRRRQEPQSRQQHHRQQHHRQQRGKQQQQQQGSAREAQLRELREYREVLREELASLWVAMHKPAVLQAAAQDGALLEAQEELDRVRRFIIRMHMRLWFACAIDGDAVYSLNTDADTTTTTSRGAQARREALRLQRENDMLVQELRELDELILEAGACPLPSSKQPSCDPDSED